MNGLLLRQVPCCQLPRCLTSAAASTSCPQIPLASTTDLRSNLLPTAAHQAACSSPQQLRTAVITHITNKREEYELAGIRDPEEIWGEEAEEEYIEVDTLPIWSPERGPVGDRIFRDADDERETKSISIEDTAYWFAEDNGGELPRTQKVKRLKEIPAKFADEMLVCEEVEGCPARLKLEELEEGDELAGFVTDIWLWHGAFVDVLAEVKGLIPIRETEWPYVHNHLLPGTQVVVRVHKINEFPKYRFPLQLELLMPEEAAPLIMAPSDYEVPANVGWMYEQGMDIQEVTKELGIPYEDEVYDMEPDHGSWMTNIAFEAGKDDNDFGYYPGDWLSRELEEPGFRDMLQDVVTQDAQ